MVKVTPMYNKFIYTSESYKAMCHHNYFIIQIISYYLWTNKVTNKSTRYTEATDDGFSTYVCKILINIYISILAAD